MRPNRTKAKVQRGQVAIGAGLASVSPELVEMAGALGFDFVTFDLEHEPAGELALAHMIRAAEAFDITPIVRLPNDPDLMLRCLDAGAQGIHVPRINAAAEARSVVDACRYYPEGKRTFYSHARSANYGLNIDDRAYAQAANREVLTICMVEEVEGLHNLEEIVRVPGVDAIHIGPRDLWQSMGMPDEAVVRETMDGMIKTIVGAGRQVSLTVRFRTDIGQEIATYAAKGVRYFTISARELFRTGAQAFFDSVRPALSGG